MQKLWMKAKEFLDDTLSLIKNKGGRNVFLGGGLFVFIYFFLLFFVMPLGVSVELGMPSPQRIIAHREVIDSFATNILRQEAVAAVPEVYDHVPAVLEEGKDFLHQFFTEIRRIDKLEADSAEDRVALFFEKNPDFHLPAEFVQALLAQSPDSLQELQGRVEKVFEEVTSKGIREEGTEDALKQVSQGTGLLPFSLEIRQGLQELLEPLVQPNMIFNPVATKANREAAEQAVEPVLILKKSLIVQEGEKITAKHIAQLKDLGLLGRRINRGGYAGLFFMLAIIFILVILYLYLFNRNIYENFASLSLLGLIVALTLVLGLAVRYFSGYLLPVAMCAILITVLFEPRLAVLVSVMMALLFGFVVDGEFNFIIVALCGGLVAVFSVSRLQRRSDLTRAGFYVGAVNVLCITALLLLNRGFQLEYIFLREFSISILAGLGNGLFSSIMAIGLLPFLESAFGLTTAITLLELADPGHPLLRKLLLETPGTYHHSVVVGNLAEAAAEATKADPLLARVAAFYHDIGKIKRPYFFVENQFTGDNPHDKISPYLSALIIRSHIKDGLELAREAKLPLPVVDIIQQHHGTGLIGFFYHQALEKEEKGAPVAEEEFRYEGPLPQTKEAAIILLADAVEAAVRSLSRPIAGRIEGTVRRIIKEKLSDGQLDEAPLTLKDLDKIGDTFVHILAGVFHQRIEYPEKEFKADLERGRK